jgi:hypothetical protein
MSRLDRYGLRSPNRSRPEGAGVGIDVAVLTNRRPTTLATKRSSRVCRARRHAHCVSTDPRCKRPRRPCPMPSLLTMKC